MYSSARGQSNSKRKPFQRGGRANRSSPSVSNDRTPDPRQMRYQVIGRTTDESDLIVQISPAFYEYIRSMAHQGVSAPKPQGDQTRSRSASRGENDSGHDRTRYNQFDHPHHKELMYGKDRGQQEQKRGPIGDRTSRKPSSKESWYNDSTDMKDIDSEMDDEYTMIKQGFDKIDKSKLGPRGSKRSTPKTNRKKP